ncbi:MAG: peptide deformylase [Pseudomonadota bacterium]
MSKLPILLHPDPRLKKTCPLVPDVTDDLRQLADDMLDTMYDAPGIGLAAPQVGSEARMFVMDCMAKEDGPPKPMVLINPEIVAASDDMNVYNEGCLSLPELFEDVKRPEAVTMRFMDVDGKEHTKEFDGLWATCAQHELDHLNGVLFIDHLSRMKRHMLTKKMVKYKKEMARV